jgi:hypothetical protein
MTRGRWDGVIYGLIFMTFVGFGTFFAYNHIFSGVLSCTVLCTLSAYLYVDAELDRGGDDE